MFLLFSIFIAATGEMGQRKWNSCIGLSW